MTNNAKIIGHMGNMLLHEKHFWQINLNLLEKALENEEKLLLVLHNDVIREIDQIQQDKERCMS